MGLVRLVVTGSVGAGKSTFVQTVSDVEAVDTDRTATDATAQIKRKTTVALDFGRLSFGSQMEIQIYGTPGQDRFNYMWDVLIQRAHICILLVAAHRPDDIAQARQILLSVKEKAQTQIPVMIGITHQDCADALSTEAVIERLGYRSGDDRPTVATVNPNDKASVLQTVNLALLALLLSQVNSASVTSTEVGPDQSKAANLIWAASMIPQQAVARSGKDGTQGLEVQRDRRASVPELKVTQEQAFYF